MSGYYYYYSSPVPSNNPSETPPISSPPNSTTAASWTEERVAYLVGALLFGIEFFAVIASFIVYLLRKRGRVLKLSTKLLFYLFAFLESIAGFTMAVMQVEKDFDYYTGNITAFVFNRLANLFFFSAFCTIVFFWASNYNKQLNPEGGNRGLFVLLRNAFVVVNVLVYIWEIVLDSVYTAQLVEYGHSTSTNNNWVYNGAIWGIVALCLLISLAFLVYGGLFLLAATEVLAGENRFWKTALRIIVITLMYVTCFTCQTVAFLYRPVSGKYMDDALFLTLAYWLPELLPVYAQLILMREKRHKDEAEPSLLNKHQSEHESANSTQPYHEMDAYAVRSYSDDV